MHYLQSCVCILRKIVQCTCIGVSGSQLMDGVLLLESTLYRQEIKIVLTMIVLALSGGEFLSKRPFEWINIFWTVMPIYVISVAFI